MSTQKQFDMAVMLCSVAEELDYAKNAWEQSLHESAATLVEDMHRLAAELAGARAGEIYGKDDTEICNSQSARVLPHPNPLPEGEGVNEKGRF